MNGFRVGMDYCRSHEKAALVCCVEILQYTRLSMTTSMTQFSMQSSQTAAQRLFSVVVPPKPHQQSHLPLLMTMLGLWKALKTESLSLSMTQVFLANFPNICPSTSRRIWPDMLILSSPSTI